MVSIELKYKKLESKYKELETKYKKKNRSLTFIGVMLCLFLFVQIFDIIARRFF
jgi:hypothetical protein